MARAITGMMRDDSMRERAEYRGSVAIEWNGGALGTANSVIPGCLCAVRDSVTNRLIPAASITVHVPPYGMVTADVGVFLDGDGEIIYDLVEVAKTDSVPATFPFLVSSMRIL